MTKEEKIAIQKKRIAELICLGVTPQLYFVVAKYLNNICYTVVKGRNHYIFFNKTFDSNRKTHSVTHDHLIKIVNDMFSIRDEETIQDIINEWLREAKIRYIMAQDGVEYWDYLTIPFEVYEPEYNF